MNLNLINQLGFSRNEIESVLLRSLARRSSVPREFELHASRGF